MKTSGNTILMTGGGSGIGEALAHRFHDRGDTVIIAGHASPLGDAPYIAHKHPNVYLETSLAWSRYCSLIPGLARQAVDIAGVEKIVFGSDFSLGKRERVTDMIDVFDKAGLSESESELIYSGNAKRILGLD